MHCNFIDDWNIDDWKTVAMLGKDVFLQKTDKLQLLGRIVYLTTDKLFLK